MDMRRRELFHMAGMAAAGVLCMPALAAAADTAEPAADTGDGAVERAPMDVFTALKTRRSIRSYTREPVSDEDVRIMLEAAMLAPSAGNERPWEFVIIRDPEVLKLIGGINKFAAYAGKAPLAVMTCLNRKKEKYKGMGILDVSACTQNLLLAAHGLGLGAVWTGVYPAEDRVKGFQELLKLPEQVTPVALVVIGHPRSKKLNTAERFDETCIHHENWQAEKPE